MPCVSVIIPNYNHEKYLRPRIESILAQTFDDFDLLILDDCSTDNSKNVINEYAAHPRVRIILNPANSGSPSVQWARGVTETTGEFIWIAESDDVAERHFLERTVLAMKSHPSIGIVFSRSNTIDEKGVSRSAMLPGDQAMFRQNFTMKGAQACRELLLGSNAIVNASAVLLRRSTVEAAGMPDPSFRLCGDWEYYGRLLAHGGLTYIAEPLNHFRCHNDSIRTTTASDLFATEVLRVHETIERLFCFKDARSLALTCLAEDAASTGDYAAARRLARQAVRRAIGTPYCWRVLLRMYGAPV